MSESEEKKDLGGLARSIDSLFAPRPTEAAAEEEHEEEDEDEAQPEEPASAPPPEPFGGPSPPPAFDSFESLPPTGAATLDEGSRPFPGSGSIVPAAPTESSPSAGSVAPDEPTESSPSAGSVAPAEPTESAPRERGAADAISADLLPEAEDDHEAPGPLAVAVESYLAGGGDLARIQELAGRHVEAREYEPVAAAVERLAQEARRRADPDVRAVADSLLDPIVLGRVVRRLGGERSEARRLGYHEACRALGERMAVAIRDELAETGDRSARRAYFDALVAMGEVSRGVIESMAADENRFLARNGVAILGEIGGGRAEELVVAALANMDKRVRREGLLAMAKLGVQTDGVDQLVVGMLDDTEPTVRLAAVVAAGELRVQRAVRPLVAWLEDARDPDEVLPILHALGQIGDPGAVPAIEKHAVRELFAKPRTEVRIAAYQALNRIGTPHARLLLNQASRDKDPEVKVVVKELLRIR